MNSFISDTISLPRCCNETVNNSPDIQNLYIEQTIVECGWVGSKDDEVVELLRTN